MTNRRSSRVEFSRTRRCAIYNVLCDHARRRRGLPSMAQCFEIVNRVWRMSGERPMALSTFRGHWESLRWRDGLIEIDEYGAITIVHSELWINELSEWASGK